MNKHKLFHSQAVEELQAKKANSTAMKVLIEDICCPATSSLPHPIFQITCNYSQAMSLSLWGVKKWAKADAFLPCDGMLLLIYAVQTTLKDAETGQAVTKLCPLPPTWNGVPGSMHRILVCVRSHSQMLPEEGHIIKPHITFPGEGTFEKSSRSTEHYLRNGPRQTTIQFFSALKWGEGRMGTMWPLHCKKCYTVKI